MSENLDMGQLADCIAEVGENSRVSGEELVGGYVVASLRHAHGDSLVGDLGTGEADEAEDHGIPAGHGVFSGNFSTF